MMYCINAIFYFINATLRYCCLFVRLKCQDFLTSLRVCSAPLPRRLHPRVYAAADKSLFRTNKRIIPLNNAHELLSLRSLRLHARVFILYPVSSTVCLRLLPWRGCERWTAWERRRGSRRCGFEYLAPSAAWYMNCSHNLFKKKKNSNKKFPKTDQFHFTLLKL